MDQNTLLTIILAAHDTFKSLSGLRIVGKNCLAELINLQIQKAKLLQYLDQSCEYYGLHKYSIQKIEQKTVEKMLQFQTAYKEKLETGVKSLQKSSQISLNQRKVPAQTLCWLQSQKQAYRQNLFQLSQILENMRQGYTKQLQLIDKKWNEISFSLIKKETKVQEKLKIFMLHVSFQSFVQDGLLKAWDFIIGGLQSKRYQ